MKLIVEFKIFHYTEVETIFWNKFLVLVFVPELFDNWSFTLTLGKFIDYILLNFDYHTNDETIEQAFSPSLKKPSFSVQILANYWTHTLRILKLDTLAVGISRGTMNILWSEAVIQRCFVKNVFLEISPNSQENTCVTVSFLVKLQAKACNFIKKEALAQVISCEFYEISKNTFFTECIWWLLLPSVMWEALYLWYGSLSTLKIVCLHADMTWISL